MDPFQNPFAPGAGTPPPELVGRDPILQLARTLVGRIKLRKPEKSILLIGLRGVGKTVLLNEAERIAKEASFRTISIEIAEDKSFPQVLLPHLKKLLFELDAMQGASNLAKKALGVLRSFISGLKLKVDDVTFGLDIEPAKGTADSGDLEVDLPELFIAIGEAALSKQVQLFLTIDELQYVSSNELAALIMAMHKIQQKQLPIALTGAGLPTLPGLAGDSKSYAERLFTFVEVGALTFEDVAKALQDPVLEQQVGFEPKALEEVFRLTKGYPYFVQEWGYKAWNLAQVSPITLSVVESATKEVIPALDKSFFRVRYDRINPGERMFLRAMAELGPGPHRINDVAKALQVKLTGLSPRRKSLITKGMIFSPAHGEVAFTVPLFDEFMKRTIPEWKAS